MTDKTNKYYDEVDEKEYELSRQNSSVPDPASRDLWQSGNVATDGSGPRIEDVAPVFARARADALSHPVTADDVDEDQVAEDNQDEAARAQAEADEIRLGGGYVAPTGPEAGQFDDLTLRDSVPEENLSLDPDEVEREKATEKAQEDAEKDEKDDKKAPAKKAPAKRAPAKKDEEDK